MATFSLRSASAPVSPGKRLHFGRVSHLPPSTACRLHPAAASRLSPAAASHLAPAAASRLLPATTSRLLPYSMIACLAATLLVAATAPQVFATPGENSSTSPTTSTLSSAPSANQELDGNVTASVNGTSQTTDILAVTIQVVDADLAYTGNTEKRWNPDTLTWEKTRPTAGTWTDDHVSFKVINHSSVGIVAAGRQAQQDGYTITPDQTSITIKTAQGTQPEQAPSGLLDFTATGTPTATPSRTARVTLEIFPLNCTHQTVDTVVAPTHTQRGYTHHVCQICGVTWDDTYTEPLGHQLSCYNVTSTTPSSHDQERIDNALRHMGNRGNGIYAFADGWGTSWSYYYYLQLDGSWYEVGNKSTYEAVLWSKAGWDKSVVPAFATLAQLQATDTICDPLGNKHCAFSTIDPDRLLCQQ